jgi:folate-binding protein YgfZ
MESPLHGEAAARGAIFGEVAGVTVPRRFGDGLAEYRAVREAVGVVDRHDLARLRLWGRDPVKMLHGLITNDLQNAPPGQGVYAAMLTPKGRAIAELRAFTLRRADDVELLVDVPREALEGTREQLKKYVPPMFARWEEVSERVGVIGVYGPRSRELASLVLGAGVPPLAEDAFVEVEWGGAGEPARVLVVGTRYAGGEDGFDLFAPAPALPALWRALLADGAALGALPVGFAALEALRVEAGRPRYGHELTEETIPTEAFESVGLMPRAVSFGKGCYTGQEVIVRIAHRGHVNRNLRGLLLGDAPLPAAGTPLLHPETGREMGHTTTAAHSPLLGQTVALAMVRRELGPGDAVRVGGEAGIDATITELPFRRGADAEAGSPGSRSV